MFEKIAMLVIGCVTGYAAHVLLSVRDNQRTTDMLKDSNVLLAQSIKVVTEQQELLRKADESLAIAKAALQEEVVALNKDLLQEEVKGDRGDAN